MADRPTDTNKTKKPFAKRRDSSVKGRLSMLPKAARRLSRRLRTGLGTVELRPIGNVTRLGPGRFRALNGDPQLLIIPKRSFPVGWVRLELRVAEKPPYPFSPQLFFDAGRGIREADSQRLPAPINGRLIAFVRLPSGVRKLRLDVGEEAGEFAVLGFRMREISEAEAWMEHLVLLSRGQASWHPAPPWERNEAILALKKRARRWLGGQAPALSQGGASLGEQPHRQPRLAFYASTSNEQRATAAQRRGTAQMAPVPLAPGVSIVILNLNKPELIVPLLDRLDRERQAFAAHDLRLQVLVGDTGSREPQVLARYEALGPDTRVQRGLKYHFSRCNNAVAAHAECDTLLFLNNDVIFPDDRNPVLDMYRALKADDKRGVVGCCMFYATGGVQHVGVDFLREPSVLGLCYHPRLNARVDLAKFKSSWPVPAVTGACLMIRHSLFRRILMDEDYAAECQDIALCLAVDRLGYEIHIVNAGHVLHLENATRPKGEEYWPDRQHFLRRWGSYIEARHL